MEGRLIDELCNALDRGRARASTGLRWCSFDRPSQAPPIIDSEMVHDRSLAGFGRPSADQFVGKYETAESGYSVGGFSVADCPDQGLTSWSTVGASFIDTGYRTAAGKPVTSEFIGCAGGQ